MVLLLYITIFMLLYGNDIILTVNYAFTRIHEKAVRLV